MRQPVSEDTTAFHDGGTAPFPPASSSPERGTDDKGAVAAPLSRSQNVVLQDLQVVR